MHIAELPSDETGRINALSALHVLDTPHEERFDRLTRLTRRLFKAPISFVSLVDRDRRWYKSSAGQGVNEITRDVSFCAHAILHDDIMVVPDALDDERFHDNPLLESAPYVRFSASRPLSIGDGPSTGTLGIIDSVPRQFGSEDRVLLRKLADLAETELSGGPSALTDTLTGISSREGFQLLGAHTLRVCNRLGRPVSMFCFDVATADPAANQLFGAPDERALTKFADILISTFNDCDVIGRVGHEQFAIVSSDSTDREIANALALLRQVVMRHNVSFPNEPMIAYDAGSAIGDPSYEIEFELLLAAAAHNMRPQLVIPDSQGTSRIAPTDG